MLVRQFEVSVTEALEGCVKGLTTVHVCVASSAQAGTSCAPKVALVCPSAETDACTVSAATTHVCVQH